MSAAKAKVDKKALKKELLAKVREELASSNASLNSVCEEIAEGTIFNANSLRVAYQRSPEDQLKGHGSQLLTDQQESVLVGFSRTYSAAGIAWGKQQIIAFVRTAFLKDPAWSGAGWFEGFRTRHSDSLTFCSRKNLDKKRVSGVSLADISRFVEVLQGLLDRYSFTADFVINVDESPADNLKSKDQLALFAADSPCAGNISTPTDALRTIVPYIAASGKVWMVLYIFAKAEVAPRRTAKKVLLQSSPRPALRGDYPRFYASTENGYMTKELWIDATEKFISVLKAPKAAQEALLFCDHLGSHLDAGAVQMLLESNIHCMFFVPHTTHFSQPLDGKPLANLKKQVKKAKAAEVFARTLNNTALTGIVQSVIQQAEKQAFTPAIIKASFKEVGLWPFDRELFLARASAAVGLVTSANSGSLQDEVAALAQHTLQERLSEKKKILPAKATQLPSKNTCYSSDELLNFASAQEKSKAQAAEEKANKASKKRKGSTVDTKVAAKAREPKKAKTAASMVGRSLPACGNCEKKARSNVHPWLCEQCEDFYLCKDCSLQRFARDSHASSCGQAGLKDLDEDFSDDM